jgi:hypothetical protein
VLCPPLICFDFRRIFPFQGFSRTNDIETIPADRADDFVIRPCPNERSVECFLKFGFKNFIQTASTWWQVLVVVLLMEMQLLRMLDVCQAQETGGLRFPNIFGRPNGNNPFSLSNLFRNQRPNRGPPPPPLGVDSADFTRGLAPPNAGVGVPVLANGLQPFASGQLSPGAFLQAPPPAFQQVPHQQHVLQQPQPQLVQAAPISPAGSCSTFSSFHLNGTSHSLVNASLSAPLVKCQLVAGVPFQAETFDLLTLDLPSSFRDKSPLEVQQCSITLVPQPSTRSSGQEVPWISSSPVISLLATVVTKVAIVVTKVATGVTNIAL